MPGLGGRGSRAEGQPGPGGRDGLCPPRRQARALALGNSRSTLRCCTGPVAVTVSSPVWLSPAPARLPEEDSVALAGVGVQGRPATPSVACTSPEGGTGRLPQHGWVLAGTLPWALQMGQAWGGGEWGVGSQPLRLASGVQVVTSARRHRTGSLRDRVPVCIRNLKLWLYSLFVFKILFLGQDLAIYVSGFTCLLR